MALDRILSRKRSEIERLHLNKLGQLNYYYRDEYGVFYEVAEDRRILRVSKLLNDWMTSIVDDGSADVVIEKIVENLMPDSLPPNGAAGGDLQGNYPNPELILVGVTAGVYGNSTNVPQVTIDAKGRVLNVVNVPITGGGGTSPDVTIDGGTIIAPTENVLIDGGSI